MADLALSELDLVSVGDAFDQGATPAMTTPAPDPRFDLAGAASASAPPQVAVVAPAPGEDVAPDGAIVIDATDDLGFRRLIVVARYGVTEEVVYQGERFAAAYAFSTAAAIAGGSRLTIRRSGGWPAAPTLDVYALDTTGGEA